MLSASTTKPDALSHMGGCLGTCPCAHGACEPSPIPSPNPSPRTHAPAPAPAPAPACGACLSSCDVGRAAPPFRWTPTAWQAAHADFRWEPAGPGSRAAFEDLLRHVDAEVDRGNVPLATGACRRALLPQWRLRCAPCPREYARQVCELEEERARLCQVLETLHGLRDRRSAANLRQTPFGLVRHFDVVCGVVEEAICNAEVEMLRLGYAFAVAAQDCRHA